MSGYGKLFDSYWTGHTGRAIQAQGADAVILGLYLPSTRHANMIGLYSLPLLYVANDLPVLGGVDAIRAALDALADVGYAFYDRDAEMVWVVEMARVRCGLRRHEPLVARDKRHAAILRLYHEAAPTPLLDRFHARYVEQLALGERRAFDVPPKPLARPFDASQQSAVSSQQYKNAAAPPKTRRVVEIDGKPRVKVLAALVLREVLPLGLKDEGDIIEAAKQSAAKRRMKYTGRTIAAAVASARAQAAKWRRRRHA